MFQSSLLNFHIPVYRADTVTHSNLLLTLGQEPAASVWIAESSYKASLLNVQTFQNWQQLQDVSSHNKMYFIVAADIQ